jgi:hypothetical protein
VTPQTETDRFIFDQASRELVAGEPIRHWAYLVTHGGGGIAAALTTKAFFGVITDRRLMLIETRVGAFNVLHENHGVRSIPLDGIKAVHVGGTVTILLATGEEIDLTKDTRTKYATDQPRFVAFLGSAYGHTPEAKALGRKKTRTTLIGIAIALVIVPLYAYYRLHGGNAEVGVSCQGAADGMSCDVTHQSGGADAHVCWEVDLVCKNGKRSKGHGCADVSPKNTTAVPVRDFKDLDACDEVTRATVVNMKVTTR